MSEEDKKDAKTIIEHIYKFVLCVYLRIETYADTHKIKIVWTGYPEEINTMQIEHMNVVKDRVSSRGWGYPDNPRGT